GESQGEQESGSKRREEPAERLHQAAPRPSWKSSRRGPRTSTSPAAARVMADRKRVFTPARASSRRLAPGVFAERGPKAKGKEPGRNSNTGSSSRAPAPRQTLHPTLAK